VDWKEIHAEAWQRMRRTGFLEWKRLSTSVVVPLLVGLIQLREGVSLPINIGITLSSGLVLYGLLILVERWVRIREVVADRIDTNEQQLARLQRPLVDVKWQALEIGRSGIEGECAIVRLKIATDEKPVTLSDWTLSTDGATRTNPFVGIGDSTGRHRFLRLAESYAGEGFLQFKGNFDPIKRWRLTFRDHKERLYTLDDPRGRP
jgi:hypothetical protein